MEFLFESSDLNEIHKAKILLESRGIPVHVNNVTPVVPSVLYRQKIGLYVFYNKQYQDAIQLLQDEKHEVSVSVDLYEHNRMLEREKNRTASKVLKWSILTLIGISIIITIMIFVVHYLRTSPV